MSCLNGAFQGSRVQVLPDHLAFPLLGCDVQRGEAVARLCGCMVYGLWFMVYVEGSWFMVYVEGSWFMVYGLWFLLRVYGLWFMV